MWHQGIGRQRRCVSPVKIERPLKPGYCNSRGKPANFNKIVIIQSGPLLFSNGKFIVTDIANRNDPVPQHFICSLFYCQLYLGRIKISFGNNFKNKIHQSRMFGYHTLHVRKFQVAMGIDESRGNNPFHDLYIFPGIFCRHNIFYHTGWIGNKHTTIQGKTAARKYSTSFEFSVQND